MASPYYGIPVKWTEYVEHILLHSWEVYQEKQGFACSDQKLGTKSWSQVYVWHKNGRIYIWQNDGERTLLVRSGSDL